MDSNQELADVEQHFSQNLNISITAFTKDKIKHQKAMNTTELKEVKENLAKRITQYKEKNVVKNGLSE